MNRLIEHPLIQPVLYFKGQTGNSDIVWNYPVFDRHITDTISMSTQSTILFAYLSHRKMREIKYTSYEVLFYYMYYPRIFAFKLFLLVKNNLADTGFRMPSLISDAVMTPEVVLDGGHHCVSVS